ncbi:hypothetical protein SCAR479_09299 [Seiridium cardinale]|uniref:Uncharacterized protein n=1 Tax=Seiridium cardinale TaxID=138064 RepID=A0ABR2XJF7_9PEZI
MRYYFSDATDGSTREPAPSIDFCAIAIDWLLQCRVHANSRCRDLRPVVTARDTQDMFPTAGPLLGDGYEFILHKRFDAATTACATPEGRTKQVQPDMVKLEDGTRYRITGHRRC